MKNFKHILSVLAALCAFAAAATAQQLSVEAPNLVEVGETFNVTFVYDGSDNVSAFNWSGGNDFQVVWGPQQGSSTSISIVNGKHTKSVRRSYTYVLQVSRPGVFVLPSATLTAKDKTYTSPERSIEVVASSQGVSSQGSSSRQQGTASEPSTREQASDRSGEGDLFLRMTLSKRNVMLGEPVRATLKLYQRVNISGFDDVKLPSFNGFWSQDVTPQRDIQFVRENYKGSIYNAAVIKDYVIIPQKAGELTIEPAEMVCLVYQRISQHTGSIFDGFFDDYTTLRRRVATPSVSVTVKDLPRPVPKGFCGGVGHFDISASLSRDSLKTHEAASLFVTVKGKGNLSLIEAPKVQFPPDFEVYDVKVTDKLDKAGGSISGSRTYEYPFIPRSSGDFTIQPVEYAWYDLDAKSYRTASTSALPLPVARGEEVSGGASDPQIIIQGINKKGVKNLGSDIRFIHTRSRGLQSEERFLLGSALFYGLLLLLLLAFFAIWGMTSLTRSRNADTAGTRTRKASRMARQRLKAAREYLDRRIPSAFYEELHKALVGYVCDKLNMPIALFTKEHIQESLTARSVAASDAEAFIALLDACEMARYSPEGGDEAMRARFEQAENLISTIDAQMNNKKISGRTAMLAVLLLMMPALSGQAADYVDSLWNKATADYSEGRYEEAARSYAAIAGLGLSSADLQYNWGNACFKSKEYGYAILHYEKALKADPSMTDARYNLELANGFIVDEIEAVPEFFLKTVVRKLGYVFNSDTWAAMFLLLLALTLAGLLLFLLSHSMALRKTGFFCGIVTLLMAAASLAFSLSQKDAYTAQDSAIVIRSVTEVRSSPTDEGTSSLFILHEGTKVRLLDSVGPWKNIELSDGRQGWLKADDLEII